MDCNSDIWLHICSHLDNAQIEAFVSTPIWCVISTFANFQLFWRARCESLTKHALPLAISDLYCWKRTYYLLLQHLHLPGAFFFCMSDELSIRVLLHIGRDPSVCNNLALRRACDAGYEHIARILLSHPNVDPRDCVIKTHVSVLCGDLLKVATYSGRHGIVRLLLEDGRLGPIKDR